MKKFISFVMAGAMVASLIPATAFAKGDVTATAKVVDALNLTKTQAQAAPGVKEGYEINETHYPGEVPELQLKITSVDYRNTVPGDFEKEVTVTLDNAKFLATTAAGFEALVTVYDEDGNKVGAEAGDAAAKPAVPDSFTADPTGEDVVDNSDPSAPEYIGKVADMYPADLEGVDAIAHLIEEGDSFDFADPTPGMVTIQKTDQADIVVVKSGGTDYTGDTTAPSGNAWSDTELVAALQDGWTFKSGADKVSLTTDGNDLSDFTVFSVDVATQITDAGYARGTFVEGTAAQDALGVVVSVGVNDFDEDEFTFKLTGRLKKDWIIVVDLESTLDKRGEGRAASVSVESPMIDADDLIYVSIDARGIKATTKKVGSIAEEEIIDLTSDIKITSTVGDFVDGQWIELKLSKGFEFKSLDDTNGENFTVSSANVDGNTAYIQVSGAGNDEVVIDAEDIEIESTSAKSGATCTMTVRALSKVWDGSKLQSPTTPGDFASQAMIDNLFTATATVEILKVVDYKVELTVDEDEDLPVIYSGVNVDNYGITDDSDHLSLEVTAKETFPGAWSMRKGFNFELPEGVYVTDVKVVDTDNFYREGKDAVNPNVETEDVRAAFWNAYQNGSHVNFEFEKRVFDDVDSGLRDRKCAEMTFQLELVADPGFEGDVVLKLTGELVDDQEVTIAKFVTPYTVKAEQNDMIIDYRYTDIPTAITITEAEGGLWARNEATFYFSIEKGHIEFEGDPTFEIDSKSDMEIKDDKASGGQIQFTVKTESDEAATITIKDMQLYMERNIPAGPYKLKLASSLANHYDGQVLWAPDEEGAADQKANGTSIVPDINVDNEDGHNDDECSNKHDALNVKADSYVGCVADYNTTVKEGFVNVVTAGRDVDDASFTTKVVVPVGESYIVAGEKQIELDTPAYINEAGYTMLPIRAVATALGINNNNVLWDQPTKTVTILYGQRIITMSQGQKVVYVNGSAIPASAAVENTNSRTFLPMRDLATALGVTDITWDQATRTATLNGNQK